MNTRRGSTEVHEFEGKFLRAPARFKVTSVIGHVFRFFSPRKYFITYLCTQVFYAPLVIYHLFVVAAFD